MGGEWIDTTIGDQVLLQRGIDITRNEQRTGLVPVVSSGGVSSFHDTPAAKGPGVVLGRKGVVGSVWYVETDYWPHDTTLWVRDFKGNNPRFVYYFFKHRGPELARLDVGSANPTLNRNHLHPTPVRWPPLAEQRAIARILGSLDDKIELNRKMNATLEAMARALFQSWFVDFDPVRAKAEGRAPSGMDAQTAKLFPSDLVESELGPIPRGWRVGRLDDLLVLQRGFDLPTHSREPGPYPVVAAGGPTDGHSVAQVRGPGVVTGRSGVLGKVFLVLEDFWPLNTALWVKEFRACGPHFAYFALQQVDFGAFNAGSAVPTLNRNHVHGLPWLLPDRPVVEVFEQFGAGIFRRRDALISQSKTLARLRDELLPRLLSGTLDVGPPVDVHGAADG